MPLLRRIRNFCIDVCVGIASLIALLWILRNPEKFQRRIQQVSDGFSADIRAVSQIEKD